MAKAKSMKQELKKAESVRDLYNLAVSFKEWFLSHILLYDKEAKDSFLILQ
jgi:hemerythrin